MEKHPVIYMKNIEYLLQCLSKLHVGDSIAAERMFISFAVQHDLNTQGIQHKVSGAFGKGKTDLVRNVLFLLGSSHFRECTMSDKSIFYSESYKDAHVLFSDDKKLSPDLEGIIKRAASNFQEPIEYETLDKNNNPVLKIMPSRIIWMLTGVSNSESDELLSRCVQSNIDSTKDLDIKVSQFIKQKANIHDGTMTLHEDEIQLCRDIFDDIKSKWFVVNIPKELSDKITDMSRRDLKMFLDHIRGYAILDYANRDNKTGTRLIKLKHSEPVFNNKGVEYKREYSIISKNVEYIEIDADTDDLERTFRVYSNEITLNGQPKLTTAEEKVLACLPYTSEGITANEIQTKTGMFVLLTVNISKIYHVIHLVLFCFSGIVGIEPHDTD